MLKTKSLYGLFLWAIQFGKSPIKNIYNLPFPSENFQHNWLICIINSAFHMWDDWGRSVNTKNLVYNVERLLINSNYIMYYKQKNKHIKTKKQC